MDTDIALARLASGRAVPIGAECGCGVHGGPPGFVWKQAKRSMLGPPFSLQVSFTTVKCRATADLNSITKDHNNEISGHGCEKPWVLLSIAPHWTQALAESSHAPFSPPLERYLNPWGGSGSKV